MPIAQANGIEITYESEGADSGAPLLMIHGYGAQLIQWPPALRDALAERGFRVIRFDNRDAGLSSKMAGADPYTLRDMALDAVGLLDSLGIDAAHVLGCSLGGAVAQRLVLDFPERVRTLTLLSTTTGSPEAPGPSPEASAVLFAPSPTDRQAYIDHVANLTSVIGGPLFDEQATREMTAARFDRGFYPEGTGRQLAALIGDGDRTGSLANVSCPTLVIHGRADSLVPLAAGEIVAAAIPGSEFLVLDQLGHDIPPALCPEMAEAIAKLADRA